VTGGTLPSPVLDITRFSPEFLWGAATAAYQIEGAVTEGGRAPSIWDTFSHTPGAITNGDTGDIACDHYHRWEHDLDLAEEFGLTAYRFSLSWARLQPDGEGPLNPTAVDFYRRLLAGLADRGIRPFVTLYHWDMPQRLEDAGGWPARATAELFADYARRAVDALGHLASDWVTLNEPWCSSFNGYYHGTHAPGRRDLDAAVAAAHHLNLAHGLAVRAIRNGAHPEARLGATNLATDVVAASDDPADVAAAARLDANYNLMFFSPIYRGHYPDIVHDLYDRHCLASLIRPGDLEIIATPTDFAGVNHYHQVIVRDDPTDPHLGMRLRHAEPVATDMGWSVKPVSLRNVLRRVHDDFTDLPSYVTESGAAFRDRVEEDGHVFDPDRIAYLDGYFSAAADAIDDGVDLRGYFVWSLLDNFEWGEGYRKRFGLIYVDYRTQQRIPKASARWYRAQIARHTGHAGHTDISDGAIVPPERGEGA
jgi:beta-glucosidase